MTKTMYYWMSWRAVHNIQFEAGSVGPTVGRTNQHKLRTECCPVLPNIGSIFQINRPDNSLGGKQLITRTRTPWRFDLGRKAAYEWFISIHENHLSSV